MPWREYARSPAGAIAIVTAALTAMGVLAVLLQRLMRARPKLGLRVRAGAGSAHKGSDEVTVRLGRQIRSAASEFDEAIYGRYLDDRDPRFKQATSHRPAAGLRNVQYHQWADGWYTLFDHQVSMTQCPLLVFEMSNRGTAYAVGIRVVITLPATLDAVFIDDVPKPTLVPPHPRDPSAGDAAGHARDSRRMEWRYPELGRFRHRRHTLKHEGAEMTPDGTSITWQLEQLEHKAPPRALVCAVKPPYECSSYIIRYTIHCEGEPRPRTGKVRLRSELLDQRQTLDAAWEAVSMLMGVNASP